MGIERISQKHSGSPRIVMTECPVCGKEFDRDVYNAVSNHLLNDHTPADFGLD